MPLRRPSVSRRSQETRVFRSDGSLRMARSASTFRWCGDRSNGKTTVKEMIAAILREHFGEAHALATEGNLNNDIGLPLTC